MIKRYRILHSPALSGLAVGQIVYKYNGYDYGIAANDTELSGFRHITVTLDDAGQGEFISLRERDIERVID